MRDAGYVLKITSREHTAEAWRRVIGTGDSQGKLIPGVAIELEFHADRAHHPSLLRILTTPAAFLIHGVRVGSRYQDPVAQSLPASRFADAGGEWTLDQVDEQHPLIMLVENISHEPLLFECEWECDRARRRIGTKYISHSTDIAVPAGVSAQITVRSQIPGLSPRELYVTPECALFFLINDVKVGNRSQTPQSGDVPASKFMHGAGAPYWCDQLFVAMDFVMCVTNIGPEPRVFQAVWACDYDPKPHPERSLGIDTAAAPALAHGDVMRIADAVAQRMLERGQFGSGTIDHIVTFPPTPVIEESVEIISIAFQSADSLAKNRLVLPQGDFVVSGPRPLPAISPVTPSGKPAPPAPAERKPVHHEVRESEFPAGELARAVIGEASNESKLSTEPMKPREPYTRRVRKDPPGFGWTPNDDD